MKIENIILLVLLSFFVSSAFENAFGAEKKKTFFRPYGATEAQLISADGKAVSNAEFRMELIVAERKEFCHAGVKMISIQSQQDSSCIKYSYLSDQTVSNKKGIAQFEGGYWSTDQKQETPVVVRVSGGAIEVPGCSLALKLETPVSRVVGKQLKQEVAAQEGCRFTYQLNGDENAGASRKKVLQCQLPTLTQKEIDARIQEYKKTCSKAEG